MSTNKRFWLSWYQPTEDARPLTYPPNEAIRGWWESGVRGDGAGVICAVVDAPGDGQAWAAVRVEWPEAERRFTCLRDDDYAPGDDRFPPSEWMEPRLGVLLTELPRREGWRVPPEIRDA